jgi:hypothetical protein
MTAPEDLPQLRMVWPDKLLGQPLDFSPPSGCSLRLYRPGDEARFFEIMEPAGWQGWNEELLQPWLAKIIPDGWFMVVHEFSV